MADSKPVCSFLLLVSTRVFFNSGRITAFLNSGGIVSVSRERFTIRVSTGRSCGRHCLMRKVGMGSSSQETELDLAIIFAMSCSETDSNVERVGVSIEFSSHFRSNSNAGSISVENLSLSFWIFDWK